MTLTGKGMEGMNTYEHHMKPNAFNDALRACYSPERVAQMTAPGPLLLKMPSAPPPTRHRRARYALAEARRRVHNAIAALRGGPDPEDEE